jgi:putative glycosyltransferase (TIGR04372 family)
LAVMWARNLIIMPRYLSTLFSIVTILIRFFSRFTNVINEHINYEILSERDLHDIWSKSPINLKFTKAELKKGKHELIKMGIPEESKIVLLNVRDSSYLKKNVEKLDFSYHNYRDCNIDNFVLVAEHLAKIGYHVIRIGSEVEKPIKSSHPMVIDYAFNGIRSEFMDIYLSSICYFIITTGSGAEGLAVGCFRKPVVYTNFCPILDFPTFNPFAIAITKHHVGIKNNKELTFKELISKNLGYSSLSKTYEEEGVTLIENTPEEILEVSLEMERKLKGSWRLKNIDSSLQSSFWDIFNESESLYKKNWHSKLRMTFGSDFLRNNVWWLK